MGSQETNTFTLALIVFVTLGTVLLSFFLSILWQHRRTQKIQQRLLLAEMAAVEKERTRIARDLHDDISPLLSVVKFQVDSVETTCAEEDASMSQASGYLDDILQRLREISNDLMPSSLLQKGLPTAIQEFIKTVTETCPINIDLAYEEEINIPPDMAANIYRIIQEVIHNARKHADAKNVWVKVKKQGNRLSLFVKDDGIGFDYQTTFRASKGIGLQSLQNRAMACKGTMQVESVPGKGTAVLFTLPINKP